MWEFTELRMYIFTSLHAVADVLGVVLNTFLIFLILFHTTRSFRGYSIIMLCCAVADLVFGMSAGFVMQRVIPVGWGLAFISHGSCRYLGYNICFTAHAITIHSAAYMITLVPVSFWYRYKVMRQSAPSPKTMVIICSIVYVPSFVAMVLYSQATATPNEMRQVMNTNNYTIVPADPELIAISGLKTIADYRSLFMCIWLCVPCFPCYTIGLFYRQRIVTALKYGGINGKTKMLQEKLITALTIQACFPLVFIVLSSTYMWKQFQFPYHEVAPYFEELVFLSFAFLSTISPVISMYYVLPYRNKIISFFRKNRRKIRNHDGGISTVYTTQQSFSVR